MPKVTKTTTGSPLIPSSQLEGAPDLRRIVEALVTRVADAETRIAALETRFEDAAHVCDMACGWCREVASR